MATHLDGTARAVKHWVLRVVVLGILCGALAGCSGSSTGDSAVSPAALPPLPTDGVHTDGQLSYAWHQEYTNTNETPSRYAIMVNGGWQPQQVSADSIAKYIADDADDSYGDTAPITLQITCKPGGATLAGGTYIRNIGGSVDVTWRTYSESGARC